MKALQYFGLFALLTLLTIALIYLPSRIESELQYETENTLVEHNLDWVEASIDGQDLTIRGAPPSLAEKERALSVLQNVDGLRVIHDQLSEPLDAPAPRLPVAAAAQPAAQPAATSGAKSALEPSESPSHEPESVSSTSGPETAGRPAPNEVLVPANLSARTRCEESLRRAFKGDTVHFQMNTSIVRPSSRKLLSRLVSAVKNDCKGIDLTIAGYTDSLGPAKVNLALSKARAKTIKDYLVRQGVPKTALKTVGYGESKPIASNKTRAGRIKNRRIEIHTGG